MASPSKEFINKILELAKQELIEIGLRKRSGNIFTRELSTDVLGWVGLNRAVGRGDGRLEINPVIGIRHQGVEKMLADLRGDRFHGYVPPTIGVHLGCLMPQKKYTPWLFEEGVDNTPVVREMTSAVKDYGFPFMAANIALDVLCETLKNSGYGVPDQLAYRLPVVYFILGKSTVAENYLRMQVERLGDRKDMAAQKYREFASKLTLDGLSGR